MSMFLNITVYLNPFLLKKSLKVNQNVTELSPFANDYEKFILPQSLLEANPLSKKKCFYSEEEASSIIRYDPMHLLITRDNCRDRISVQTDIHIKSLSLL